MRLRFVPRRPWRALAVAAVVAAVPVLAPEVASAAPAGKSPGTQCVLDVIGQAPDGELLTAPMRCYATYDALLASEGIVLSTPSDSRTVLESAQEASRLLTTSIATHYTGFGSPTPGLSIMGNIPCTNGWLNMPAGYVNNISSTYTDCGYVRHYDAIALGGTFGTTTTGLQAVPAAMDNRTESAQYRSTP